jgi:hypothetical protein
MQLIRWATSWRQVGGVEAFGEPVVNVGEHRARFVVAAGGRGKMQAARAVSLENA